MSQAQLFPVSFHGDTIYCATLQDQPFSPVKPIVENMGLDWCSQQRKLDSNPSRWGMVIMTMPTSSGPQQTLCLPVRKLPAFLSSINPNKVKPELRAKIRLYQEECDDALWNYWMKGRAERSSSSLPAPATDKTYKTYILPAEPYLRLSTAQMQALRSAHKAWSEEVTYNDRFKAAHSTWLILKGHFGGVSRLDDLPADWFLDLIEFCHDQQEKELERRRARRVLPATRPVPALPPVAAAPRPNYDVPWGNVPKTVADAARQASQLALPLNNARHTAVALASLIEQARETLDALHILSALEVK